MIKGISDVRRLPRLGKIHLGIKKVNSNGVEYPAAVDYFVVPPEVAEVYGDSPKELDIVLPSENPDVFFPQWYKRYSYGKGLICKGDGVTATVRDENGGMTEIACHPETCPYYQKGECKPVANLLFILPKVKGFGVYQIDTSSINNIININSEIALLKSILGRISGVPLKLTREVNEVTQNGKRRKVAFIHIRSPYSMLELQNRSKQLAPPEEVAIEQPDNDVPEEVPEEIDEEPEPLTEKDTKEAAEALYRSDSTAMPAAPQQRNIIDLLISKAKNKEKIKHIIEEYEAKGNNLTYEEAGRMIVELQKEGK